MIETDSVETASGMESKSLTDYAAELAWELTLDPSDQNINSTIEFLLNLMDEDGEKISPELFAAMIELIGMATEPVHEGITERLRRAAGAQTRPYK